MAHIHCLRKNILHYCTLYMYASITVYQGCVMPVSSIYALMRRVYKMLSKMKEKKIVFLPSYPGLNTHTLKSTLQYLAPYCPSAK
jgi:hypothetical protein